MSFIFKKTFVIFVFILAIGFIFNQKTTLAATNQTIKNYRPSLKQKLNDCLFKQNLTKMQKKDCGSYPLSTESDKVALVFNSRSALGLRFSF